MRLIKLGPVDKIPMGQGHCFIIDNQEISVFRSRAGKLFALQNRCPHRNAPLCDGIIDHQHVVCPFHGHKFDLKTGKGLDADEAVQTFRVVEHEGEIMVEL